MYQKLQVRKCYPAKSLSEVDTCLPILCPYYHKCICHSSLQMFPELMYILFNIFKCTLHEELWQLTLTPLHSIWLNQTYIVCIMWQDRDEQGGNLHKDEWITILISFVKFRHNYNSQTDSLSSKNWNGGHFLKWWSSNVPNLIRMDTQRNVHLNSCLLF